MTSQEAGEGAWDGPACPPGLVQGEVVSHRSPPERENCVENMLSTEVNESNASYILLVADQQVSGLYVPLASIHYLRLSSLCLLCQLGLWTDGCRDLQGEGDQSLRLGPAVLREALSALMNPSFRQGLL